MTPDFEKYEIRGSEFVKLVADELEVSMEKAGLIIRAVFHALRNQLVHEESFQLIAQLPMALKGVFVDGWKFDKDYSQISYLNDFLNEVGDEDGGLAVYDFGNNIKAKAAVAAIFKALHYFVSDGELNDVINMMPTELKNFIKKSLVGDKIIL